MKKYLLPIILILAGGMFFLSFLNNRGEDDNQKFSNNSGTTRIVDDAESKEPLETNMPNPASKHCVGNGGTLEIVTDAEGDQFGLCNFEEYSCEEWAYFRRECDIEGDTIKIRDALIEKGLNLAGMKVVIHKHMGKDIVGGVVPVDFLGGGGYVFATKGTDGAIEIVADGNGAIMCTMLEDYPDFSTYLIPDCIDDFGEKFIR